MVACLLQEIRLQQHYLDKQPVHTIYFGGGTPSLLPTTAVEQLIDAVHRQFPVATDAEITLEANPDDLSVEKLKELQQAGINRLSIGVQSFFDPDLQWMNRSHSAAQALQCIRTAQERGFTNLSIDLIYGLPCSGDESWHQNIEQAIALSIPHLSCYALTVEPSTALDHFISQHKIAPVNPDLAAHQFEWLMEKLSANGYVHYEISNFAKPGMQSRHNSSYWQGAHYLGIGPSAHSFNGTSRQWNVSNNALYIQGIENGMVPFEKEVLTPVMQFNEYIMTALRTAVGCHLTMVATRWGIQFHNKLVAGSKKFIQQGWMEQEADFLRLTRSGKLMADGIAAELFEI